LGVNGQLLSPHFGSRARLQLIITDAHLDYDSPIDYGMYKFCELCQVCFMRCPGKAIQAQRVWFRGVEKNKLIAKRCRPNGSLFRLWNMYESLSNSKIWDATCDGTLCRNWGSVGKRNGRS